MHWAEQYTTAKAWRVVHQSARFLERVAKTRFGSTIAHGLLTLALLPKLIETMAVIPATASMVAPDAYNLVAALAQVTFGANSTRPSLREFDKRLYSSGEIES